MSAVPLVAALVFVAEVGDESQPVALRVATRYRTATARCAGLTATAGAVAVGSRLVARLRPALVRPRAAGTPVVVGAAMVIHGAAG